MKDISQKVHLDLFPLDRQLQLSIQFVLPSEPRREPNSPDDPQRVIMERLDRFERGPDPFRFAGDKAEVGEPLAGLVLDGTGAEVVEEGVDGQVSALGVLDGSSERLGVRAGGSVHKVDRAPATREKKRLTTVGIRLPVVYTS